MDSSKSIPSNLDNLTPSSKTPDITFVAVKPALANASKPSVIESTFIPNLLEYSIAFSPIIPALIDSPPIACTFATACSNFNAFSVAEAKAAVAATPTPIAKLSVCVKYSEVLKAINPKRFEIVFDIPANSALTSVIPLADKLNV